MNVIAKIDSQALDLWAGYLAGIVQNGSDSEDEIFLGVLSILGWAFFSLVAVLGGCSLLLFVAAVDGHVSRVASKNYFSRKVRQRRCWAYY